MPYDKVRSAELAQSVYELRLAGHPMHAVAEALGVSQSTCERAFDEWIVRTVRPKAEAARSLELDRLDRYLVALDPLIQQGNVKAIAEARAIGERRSKLLGLDLPTRVEHKVAVVDAVDEEIARLLGQQPVDPVALS